MQHLYYGDQRKTWHGMPRCEIESRQHVPYERPLPFLARISIVLPPWATGEHGDIVSALVLSILHGAVVEKPAPKDGSAEWEQQQREQRQKAVRDQVSGSKQPDRGQVAFWRRR